MIRGPAVGVSIYTASALSASFVPSMFSNTKNLFFVYPRTGVYPFPRTGYSNSQNAHATMVDVRDVKNLSFSGHTLNVAERALLGAAILKKGIEENLAGISFWGKLFGKEANYLIAVGAVQKFSGVPSKKFYYLVSGGENPSSELAECEHKFAELAAKNSGKQLEGVPETVLQEAEEEDGESFTEAHLVAHTVKVRTSWLMTWVLLGIGTTTTILQLGFVMFDYCLLTAIVALLLASRPSPRPLTMPLPSSLVARSL